MRTKNKSNLQKKFDKKSKQHTSYTLEWKNSFPQSLDNGQNESSVQLFYEKTIRMVFW